MPDIDPYVLVVHLKARPGSEEELARRLSALVAPTRREAGCLDYRLHCSQEDPAAFTLYEVWRSRADLDAHLRTPYLVDFFARKDEVLAGEMDMRPLSRMV